MDPTRFQLTVGVTTAFYDTRGAVFCLQSTLKFSQARKWFRSGLFTSQALLLILSTVCLPITFIALSSSHQIFYSACPSPLFQRFLFFEACWSNDFYQSERDTPQFASPFPFSPSGHVLPPLRIILSITMDREITYRKLETFRDAKYSIVLRRGRRTRLLGDPLDQRDSRNNA